MKNIEQLKNFCARLALAVLITGVAVSRAHAEATIEVSRDFGVIGGPFAFGSAGYDPNFFDFSAPEGRTAFRLGIDGGTVIAPSGGGWGTGNDGRTNYTGYSHLRFWLNSTADIKIEIQHSGTLKSGVTIPSTSGAWQEIVLRLDATGPAPKFDSPVNVANVQNLFLASNFTDRGEHFFKFDHIRWTKPVSKLAMFPNVVTANPNDKRQVTVEGRDAANELVIVYAGFSANATAGSMNPAAPLLVTASTLTAAGSIGVGAVTATVDAVSSQSVVNVTNDNVDAAFGLVSETIPGVRLTVDSNLGFSAGGGAAQPTVTDDFAQVREGVKSWKTTVNTTASQFSGWFIQWGLDSDANVVQNFSSYYDGAIRFWFKGESQLATHLEVGIQSSNVTPPESNLAKVSLLNRYAADGASNLFDNNWHPVIIPVSELAGARPWADISRTKILFSVYSVGDTGGTRAFYIDNLRWDTRLPGALNSIVVTPNPITVPLSAKRTFSARGVDANGVDVDIFPTWTTTVAGGSVAPSPASSTILTTPNNATSGNVTATFGGKSGSAAVTVAALPITQSYNVYSDAGAGGFVGVSFGGAAGTGLFLKEPNTGSIEGSKFFRSTYTLQTDAITTRAFANWFVEETNTSRFMGAYDTGYLQFYVRTDRDLRFSIRSANIAPGFENSAFTLSELGVPLDNNWQLVVVALADFKAREPNLDFSQIQNYFTITALSTLSGTNSAPYQFDVDNVRWSSIKPLADGTKVYAGLRGKQNGSTGLVLSFDLDTNKRAVTYDNALAAMAFTYQKDFAQTAALLNAYKARFNLGGFAGFHDEYKWDVPNTGTVLSDQRTAGPNAWLLLSIIHYRNASLDHSFDAMATGIATWLKTLQDGDGGIRFGFIGGTSQTNKSTEHNFDVYAAFYSYARAFNDPSYATSANSVRSWLDTRAWTGSRFLVGRNPSDGPNSDRALDVYSWAPLALSSYTSVLTNPVNGAEVSFSTRNVNVNTSLIVDGFDFSSYPSSLGNNDTPADRDAVWLEGTAHMALAYLAAGNVSKWDYYVGQLTFAIFATGADTEGLTYATNPGSAYGAGFVMDATHPAASSMAWYLFARNQFNPFKVFPIHAVTPKNISNNVITSSITWNVNVPVSISQRWVLASQYIELDTQRITVDPWGIQIYTDNTNAGQSPRFIDPTPANTSNPDSNPAGLLPDTGPTTSQTLSLAWRIQDSTAVIPTAVQPFSVLLGSEGPQSSNWFFFLDHATPAIDLDGDGSTGGPNDGLAFQDGQISYAIIKTPDGIQVQQGPVYLPSTNPDYIYLESDFSSAAAQVPYVTQVVIEFFKV